MPFEIGKVFSDGAIANVQRKQEADRQFAMDQYRLELARRQAIDSGRDQGRQLDISQANADANRALQERQMNLDRVQSDRQFGEGQRQFGINKEMQDQDQQLRALDLGQRADQQQWERDSKFPVESGIKLREIDRKESDSTARQAKYDAQVEQIKAQTKLTQAQARDLLGKAGIRDSAQAMRIIAEKRKQFDSLAQAAATGGYAGDPAEIEQAKNGMLQAMALLKTADPASYDKLMKTEGMSLERSMGSPYAGEDENSLINSLKPPPVPRGK